MAIRESIAAAVRRFADVLGPPAFAGTPFPSGGVDSQQQLTQELGGTGTNLWGGFIRGEDFNPQMDAQTAIKNFDEMRRGDSQVHAALEVVKLPIRTAKYQVDPADPDDPTAKMVADFVEWNLMERMTTTWDDVVRQSLLMLDFGFMIFEKVWSVEETGDWAGHIVLHKLAPRPPKTIWQWFTDTDGTLISIKQLTVKAGTYQFLDVPASKLVRFTFQQEGDNFTGISMLRSAYPHWLIKKQMYLIDAIRATRYGVGIPRAKLMEGYKPTIEDKSAIAQMLQGMSSHQHAYIIQPPQMEIDILVPQVRQGGAEILPSIEHQNEQITRNILAQFLDMGGRANGGSRALGSSAMRFFLNAIEAIAGQICDVMNKQIVKDLVDMNFDVGGQYPKIRPVGIRETDVQQMAAAVAALATAGMLTPNIDTENAIRDLMNLPENRTGMAVPGAGLSVPGSMDPAAAAAAAVAAPVSGGTPATPATSAATPAAPVTNQPMQARTDQYNMVPANTTVADMVPAVSTVTAPTQATLATPIPTAEVGRSDTSSSGAADEEGHSSSVAGLSPEFQLREPKRRPWTMPDGQTTFWRQPTVLEDRVLDLRELPKRLNTARTALESTLKGVREEQILRFAPAVARAGPKTEVKPQLVGKMASVIEKTMHDVYDYGYESVHQELRRQRHGHRIAFWDESQHPRVPSGSSEGGEFTSSTDSSGTFHASVRSHRIGHMDENTEEMLSVLDAKGVQESSAYQTGKILEDLTATHSTGNQTAFGQIAKMDKDYRGLIDEVMKPGGGFTYNVVSRDSPKDGFVFSIGGHEKVFDAPTMNATQVWDYVKANWETLNQPGHYLGGWEHNTKVYLDISRVVGSRDEAMRLAIEHKQMAFYDVKAGKSHYTPAGAAEAAREAAQRSHPQPKKDYTNNYGTKDYGKTSSDATRWREAADPGGDRRVLSGDDRTGTRPSRYGEDPQGIRGNGEGQVALSAASQKKKKLPLLVGSAQVSAQTAADKLLASARGEALRLRRAGWEDAEIEDALKIHMGELSDADITRLSAMEVNEAFSLGRTAAASELKDQIKVAIYSAILDKNVCPVCEALDGEEFDVDSDQYEENMPPNANCEGGDQCRCTYIYELDPEASGKGLSDDLAFGGEGSGDFGHAGRPGEVGGSGPGGGGHDSKGSGAGPSGRDSVSSTTRKTETSADAAAHPEGQPFATDTRGRPDPNLKIQTEADEYNALHGLPPVVHEYVPVDQQLAGQVADAYDALPMNDSNNADVERSYTALAREVNQQWDAAVAHGMKFEPDLSSTDAVDNGPYKSSFDVTKDIRDNRHLYFFTGGEPNRFMSEVDPKTGYTVNDKFRAIHDYYGHAAGGYGFGPRGEFNAWVGHSQMFSPLARRAMTTETLGQNSWVNFGKQNYNADGSYKHIPPADRPYATQKTALLPEKFMHLKSGSVAFGSAASGNYGHAGRPGEVGGSAASGSGHLRLVSSQEAINAMKNKRAVTIHATDLRAMYARAIKEPTALDLTHVTVDGHDIFGNGLGIKRIDMPQIPREHQQEFISWMRRSGVSVQKDNVAPEKLRPSQSEIDARRVGKKLEGLVHDDPVRPIFISKDNYVLDGHHRWAAVASLSAIVPGQRIKIPVMRIGQDHRSALDSMHRYGRLNRISRQSINESIAASEWWLFDNEDDDDFAFGNAASGNYGHAGRPGEVGGSGPGGWPIHDSVERKAGKHFPDKMEALAKNWADVISEDERLAVSDYTEDGYADINKKLRTGTASHSTEMKAQQISSALNKFPKPPPPELVWRVMSESAMEKVRGEAKVGDIVKLDGFQSTTINPGYAADQVVSYVTGKQTHGGYGMMEIKPAAGAYVRPISAFQFEDEFILPTGYHYRYLGTKHIHVNEVTNRTAPEGRRINADIEVVQLEMLK